MSEDSLKQKALELIAEKETGNIANWKEYKEAYPVLASYYEKGIDLTLRVVFEFAEQKEKEAIDLRDRSELNCDWNDYHEYKGEVRAWRDLKQKTKE